MRLLKPIQENPVAILCVAILALIGWMAVDLSKAPPRKDRPPDPDLAERHVPPPPLMLMEIAPAPAAMATLDTETLLHVKVRGTVVSAALLPQLRPGMTRAEVERLLGPPGEADVQPARINEGRVTYCTAYECGDLDPPMTIRPIRPMPRIPPQPEPAGSPSKTIVVALEFDASRPGHPLVEVVYPDPLF